MLNLPLRQPAVLARAAASLDLLSGGRFELGLGAGGFWDPIAAMGGPRRTPGESIEALEEAITIIRALWDTSERGGVFARGKHYQVAGAKRGPAPAHPIGIWIGAYKPRMLRLTGRQADGWLPSLSYIKSLQDLADANATIDQAATKAGRDPRAVRRFLNIGGQFTPEASNRLLVGPPEQWVQQLAALTLQYGFSGYILMGDDPTTLTLFAQEVAPALRELVADERGAVPAAAGSSFLRAGS